MRFVSIILIGFVVVLASCSNSMTKLLKNPDAEYKYRMAEQYFVKKKYSKAQLVYEDIMPYYRQTKEFEDIYYKYAYCAYYQDDYMNAENLFKSFVEIFPGSPKVEEVSYMRAYCYYKQSPKAELDQTNTVRTIGMMQTYINMHPTSAKVKEATNIIDLCRKKLEVKDFKAAKLYYDMQQYRAAAVAFTTLLDNYPDSEKADEYQLQIIKSHYRYAQMSVVEKQSERYEKVISAYYDFNDRFPESKLKKEAEDFLHQSQSNIKKLSNEQTKTST
jgi:outer membrane protein assembly factor BamD